MVEKLTRLIHKIAS